MFFFINGYGAPQDPLNDSNYDMYLSQVQRFIVESGIKGGKLFLAGGYTNNPYLSEAQAMKMWFDENGWPPGIETVRLLEETTTVIDNLMALAGYVFSTETGVFFFEHARRFHMRFLIGKFFTNNVCVPIKFDRNSSRLVSRLKNVLRYFLTVVSWYVPLVDKYIQQPLRARHVQSAKDKLMRKK